MPKLLFSKIRIYEFKDLIQNAKQPRRIDVLLSRRRRKKDIQCILVHKTQGEVGPSQCSHQDDIELRPNLKKMIQDKKCLGAFRAFLRSEFSEENIEFWLAVEEFKSTSSPCDLREKAEEIYREFLHPKASREVNVDHCVRERIKRSLMEPGQSCFDEAQRHVYLLMQRDSCPRFLRSDTYLSLRCKTRSVWYM